MNHRTENKNVNVWIIELTDNVSFNKFHVEFSSEYSNADLVKNEDALLLINRIGYQIYFAKIFTIEKKDSTYKIYFKGLFESVFDKDSKVNILTIELYKVNRIEWTLFENILTDSGTTWDEIPVFSGSTLKEQAYIRDLLELACERDLVGPAGGPDEEIIGMSVRDRYLIGKLAPKESGDENIEGLQGAGSIEETPDSDEEIIIGHHHTGEEFASADGRNRNSDDENPEGNTVSNQSLVPSSMGFTFCVDAEVEKIEVEVKWGRYIRTESERIDERTGNPFRCWKRITCRGVFHLPVADKKIIKTQVADDIENVFITSSISFNKEKQEKLVTIFLVNDQASQKQNQDERWLFQPEIIVRDLEKKPIFRKRPVHHAKGFDLELANLNMLYRDQVEFAVGHGISVHAESSTVNLDLSDEIRTQLLPSYEVPITETPGFNAEDRPAMRELAEKQLFDMQKLSNMSSEELQKTLMILIDDYDDWIKENLKRSDSLGTHADTAKIALKSCQDIKDRLKLGVDVLMGNNDALEAFRFANKAMALQRIHSIYSLKRRRGEQVNINEIDKPANRSWRPFQLAFVLLSIPGLADPDSDDRNDPNNGIADLLWFPTGGGKTEAYLGVAAFTMAIRRLQGVMGGRDASRGLAVIMRYTLRLLTIQQFQRATTLICAMEVLRKDDPKWGKEPFRIGLWVGAKTTANTAKAAEASVESERDSGYSSGTTSEQLTNCPWCGTETVPSRDLVYDKVRERRYVYCGDKRGSCDFSKAKSTEGLPVLEVDEEIYRNPPSMMIATVDKFALIAWKGQTRNLFGKASIECLRHGLISNDSGCNGRHNKINEYPSTQPKAIVPFRPPDLIIQDELHLISGPLGTMVGLYESAIDKLCSWNLNGRQIKPKIIASTATVRKAAEQVNNLFMRNVSIFPPSGIDVKDNFFSVQRPVEDRFGRKYLGICSPGSSRPSVLIRIYTALLTASQELFDTFGKAADPYMTLVGYFNSLRELGGMRRLTEDDVRTRAFRVQMSDVYRPGLAQRSIKEPTRELTSRVSNKDIPKTLDQLEVQFKKNYKQGEDKAIDIVLATNMLSVGVDVNRLGLMVVNGQTKNVSEYIQATSRVGRQYPGLVCTVLTWARPRDLSHYETFEYFHATFYKHVEAQSVTPFSARALDRGLTGTFIGIMRNEYEYLNPNIGAEKIGELTQAERDEVKTEIANRAWKVKNKESMNLIENMLGERFDKWLKESSRGGRTLGFDSGTDVVALLEKPSNRLWSKWTVPYSMREVEPGVRLIMKTDRIDDTPKWSHSQNQNNEEGKNE